MAKRPVIVHFHLFKNAGTSVDTVLEKNFGERWIEIEGPNARKLTQEALVEFIESNPQYDAISSHTAIVGMPVMDTAEIIPIFFFRHPIDRIRSAYDFECTQNVQTPGAIKAKEGDFEHYMNWRLSTPTPWQVSEFHAFRLKDFHTFTPAKQTQLFLPRAKQALDALPFIGLVEEFNASMIHMEQHIQKYFPNFAGEAVHKNTTSDPSLKLSQNVEKFKNRIGETVFDKLTEVNEMDFELYHFVKNKIANYNQTI
ncbi:MAG: sulfotransferase family 2 domain-containing protein [Maricaulaceae bacterium]